MFDPKKLEALKALGFSDDDIAGLQSQASATEKAATDQGVAFKAEEPAELPDIIVNGVTYKAFKPVAEEAAVEAVVETDAVEDLAVEEEVETDDSALTLSTGDLQAITQAFSEAIQGAVAQIMGGLDLEKKVAGHVQGFLAPLQQAQTTKDAEQAQTRETVSALQAQIAELTGNQPASQAYRPSAARDNVLTDAAMLAAVKQATDPEVGPFDDILKGLGIGQPRQ